MDREIKFRGKSLKDKKWVYGDLMSNICGTRIVRYKETDNEAEKRADWTYIDVEPDSVGQFTGLTDCEGKGIYEGDIVEAVYKYEGLGGNGGVIPDCDCICKGIIEWNGNVSGWVLKILSAEYPISQMLEENEIDCVPLNIFYEEYMGSDYTNECMEVIGNIHDNPELIPNQPTAI